MYLPLLLAVSVAAKPIIVPHAMTDGFINPELVQSAGGKATCVAGTVRVHASATNTKLLYDGPANQMNATETIVEILQVNSDFATKVNGGPITVTGTFDIYSKLCFPANTTTALNTVKTLQFLTHGATLDLNYWDIAPDYSYVDAAADAGYASFSYDRLGTGKSQHPDPIQIVQAALQLQIHHILIQSLRTGSLGGKAFQTVVGVGHSAGSTFTQGITSAFPKDFDAVILSGTSSTPAYVGTATAAFDLEIANTDPSGNFKGLANGYLTQANSIGIQFSFWRYPYFDPNSKFSPHHPSKEPTPFRVHIHQLTLLKPPTLSLRQIRRPKTNQHPRRAPHPRLHRLALAAIHRPRRRPARRKRLRLLRRQLQLPVQPGRPRPRHLLPGRE